MGGMRDFTDKFKISARSAAEVSEMLANVVSRFRTRGFDIGALAEVAKGRSFSREICLNALVVYLARSPVAEQERVLREGIAGLVEILRDAPEGPSAELPEGAVVVRAVAEQNLDAAGSRTRKAARGGGRRGSSGAGKGESVGKDKGPDREGSPSPRR
jgi:hypothetical protein